MCRIQGWPALHKQTGAELLPLILLWGLVLGVNLWLLFCWRSFCSQWNECNAHLKVIRVDQGLILIKDLFPLVCCDHSYTQCAVLWSKQPNEKRLTWGLVSCCRDSRLPLESCKCGENMQLIMLGTLEKYVLMREKKKMHCMVWQVTVWLTASTIGQFLTGRAVRRLWAQIVEEQNGKLLWLLNANPVCSLTVWGLAWPWLCSAVHNFCTK